MTRTSHLPLMPRLALVAAGLVVPALPGVAATAPFTETYTGNTFTVGTPSLQDGAGSSATLTLVNDALEVKVLDSTRTSIVLDVPDAAPVLGLSVTQTVDFTVTDFLSDISRLGFVFAASPAESAGEGPADAVYAYLREPSGDFGASRFFVNAFDETGSQISISNEGAVPDPNRFVPVLSEDVTYALSATLTFEANGDERIDMSLIDTATAGAAYSVQYSFTMPDESGLVDQAELDAVLLNWGATTDVDPSDLEGDYNNSLQVEQGDLDLVLLNWGSEFGNNPGDATPDPGWLNDLPFNGEVNGTNYGLYIRSFFSDAAVVFDNWSLSVSGGVAVATVPEPGTLLGFCMLAVAARRHRC